MTSVDTMRDNEREFENRLRAFNDEAQLPGRYFCADLTLHVVTSEDEAVLSDDAKYRAIRGKILAHRVFVGAAAVERYALTRKDELNEICACFPSLYQALRQLYDEGIRPEIQQRSFSINEIREGAAAHDVQRLVVLDTEQLLRSLANEAAE